MSNQKLNKKCVLCGSTLEGERTTFIEIFTSSKLKKSILRMIHLLCFPVPFSRGGNFQLNNYGDVIFFRF